MIEKTGNIDEEEVMLEAIDAGAEDVNVEDEYIEITTEPADFSAVREKLESYNFEQAEIQMIPTTYANIPLNSGQSIEKLIDALEDNDDVQNIYHNWEQE